MHWIGILEDVRYSSSTVLKCGFYLNIAVRRGDTHVVLGQKFPGIEQKVSVTFAETIPIYGFADD
ncbi:hypothetical protein SAMN05216327_106120 [Dyadobacter sp. SG02]|nr:hypothetical protein SAMN05216327_106120 [Dyadobacter sp. SG02]